MQVERIVKPHPPQSYWESGAAGETSPSAALLAAAACSALSALAPAAAPRMINIRTGRRKMETYQISGCASPISSQSRWSCFLLCSYSKPLSPPPPSIRCYGDCLPVLRCSAVTAAALLLHRATLCMHRRPGPRTL